MRNNPTTVSACNCICHHPEGEGYHGKDNVCKQCGKSPFASIPSTETVSKCDCVYEWELVCHKCGGKSPNLTEKYTHLINSPKEPTLPTFIEDSHEDPMKLRIEGKRVIYSNQHGALTAKSVAEAQAKLDSGEWHALRDTEYVRKLWENL